MAKTETQRLDQTLIVLAGINQDAEHFVKYCLDVAVMGNLYVGRENRQDTDHGYLINNKAQVSNALSLGMYIGGDGKQTQRALRRALMLLGLALGAYTITGGLGKDLATVKSEIKHKTQTELTTMIQDLWKNYKFSEIQSFIRVSEVSQALAAFGSIMRTPAHLDALNTALATGLYAGHTSDDKYKADIRGALLVLTFLAQDPTPVNIATFLNTQKGLILAKNIGELRQELKTMWWTYQDNIPENRNMNTLWGNFHLNRLTFLENYSLHVNDGSIVPGDSWTIREVEPGHRVVRMGFTRRIRDEEGALDVIPLESATRGGEAYFLPWKEERIVKLTIPANTGPDIFFTAAINGCSVFVTGTARNPTIYHGGVGPNGIAAYNHADHGVIEAKTAGNAALFWRRLLKVLAHISDTDIKGEVNKNHYIVDKVNNTKGIIEPSVDTTPHARAYEQNRRTQPGLTVTSCGPWGCVLGFRDHAQNWAFYLQENAVIHYTQTSTSHKFVTCRPLFLSKIFPATNNIAATSNYLNVPSNFDTVYDGTNVVIPTPFVESERIIKKPG